VSRIEGAESEAESLQPAGIVRAKRNPGVKREKLRLRKAEAYQTRTIPAKKKF